MSRPLESGRAEIEARLVRAARILLLSDFDGTVAPLVDRPEDARPTPGTAELLRQLARRPGFTVGVMSGRALADVRDRVGIAGLIYAGNHGLEIAGPGVGFMHPVAVRLRPVLAELAGELSRRVVLMPGVFVEDKGLTLSVHFRLAALEDAVRVPRLLRDVVMDRSDVSLMEGKSVYELRPRVAWDKGVAARWLVEQLGEPAPLVVILGDDRTDEDAFRALPNAVSVKVGEGAGSRAKYYVDSSAAALQFLEWLMELPRDA